MKNRNTYIYFKNGTEEGYFLNWRDKYCLISKEDKKLLENNTWNYDSSRDVWRTTVGGKKKLLHRYIFGLSKKSKIVDHINHNRSDNRRSNLRLTTQLKNMYNQSVAYNSATGVKGVCKMGDKWMARISFNHKLKYLGLFTDFKEAVRARLLAEQKYHKEYGFNNTIGEIFQ